MGSPDELKPSPRYDRIVAASRQIAWDLSHTYVGVEHLFLAIVQDPDAVPTQVLSRFVPPAQVGAAVRGLITSEGWAANEATRRRLLLGLGTRQVPARDEPAHHAT